MSTKRNSVLLGLALFLAQLALAQPREARDPVGENLFPPELVMQNQSAIGLGEEQKTFIRIAMQEAQGKFMEHQWQLSEAMEQMDSLLKQDPVDEARVIAHLDRLLDAERDIKRTQLTLLIRIKNELTPEQRARLRELR